MGRAVPAEGERLGAVRGHDPDHRVADDRIREIDELAIDDAGQRRPGEAWRNAFRDLANQGPGGRGAAPPTRPCDGDVTHSGDWRRRLSNGELMVGTGGLEPPTSCVSSRRSNL